MSIIEREGNISDEQRCEAFIVRIATNRRTGRSEETYNARCQRLRAHPGVHLTEWSTPEEEVVLTWK